MKRLPWDEELQLVVELMRELSKQTDPHAAAKLYGRRVREGLVPADEFVAISRRGLPPPLYRITRSTTWKEDINPWKQSAELPVHKHGLLGDMLYADGPTIIEDVSARLRPDDPAHEYLRDMQVVVSMPQWEDGEVLNMGFMLLRDRAHFDRDTVPFMLWQSNLYGRGTLNLVLKNQLKSAYEALDREMKIVGDIQRSLLPRELPSIAGLELAAHYQTSQRAGGDYYDFFPLSDGRWGVFIADVSGHGPPSAVVMAITHAIAHSMPGDPMPPQDVLGYVNRRLANEYTAGTGTFVTAFYAIYSPLDRTLHYATAGHNPPRLSRGGRVEGLDAAEGLPLGIAADFQYGSAALTLRPDDLLLLYTDGITEAFSPTGDMFGADRLDEALLAARSARGGIAAVLDAVAAFAQSRPADDDRTLLALRAE